MDKPKTFINLSTRISLDEIEENSSTKDRIFTQLYHQTVTIVFRYLYSRVNNIEDAEDLTSQTFITAYEKLGKLRDPKKFIPWVFTIARNKVNDFFRKSQRCPPIDDGEKLEQSNAAIGTISREDQDRLLDLEALIKNLRPHEQEYLRLRLAAELPFAEIAAILKMPEIRIKKRYYRLIDRLKRQMEV
jgi:RNA polymerase sigma-70 factor (ECF subfamily)